MKINKIIINLLIILILTVIQVSFFSNFRYLNFLNLILTCIIFIGINNLKLSLFWAIIGGFFLDLFSFLPFGAFILIFVLLAFLINLLVKNFLPGNSLISVFAIGLIGISFYFLFLLLIAKTFYFLKINDFNFILNKNNFVNFGWSLLSNLILILLLFPLQKLKNRLINYNFWQNTPSF